MKLFTLATLTCVAVSTTGLTYLNQKTNQQGNTEAVMNMEDQVKAKKYEDVDKAIKETSENKRPLVIVISGDFCSWCTKQKQEIESKKDPMFDYCFVDYRHPICKKIKQKGGIPQLHIITETDKIIRKEGRILARPRLGYTTVGYKPVSEIKKMIKEYQAPKIEEIK